MEYIYLDTSLLAVPNYAVDAESAQELIDRISHFAKLALPAIPVTLVIAANAAELLWSINCGPDHDQVASFIDLMELGHYYSARDLVRQYHSILDRAANADLVNPIEVKSISSFAAAPALPDALVPCVLRPETERVFAAVAALQSLYNAWNVGSGIQGVGASTYNIEAQIEDVSGERAELLGSMPVAVSRPVRAFAHLSEMVSTDAAERLWRNVEDNDDLHFALTIGALSLLKAQGQTIDLTKIRRFYIGPGFQESLKYCQCFGTGRFASTTRALCSQIIANECTRPVGKFGRPDQVERSFDAAKAWRVHITEGAEGLRLMYWATDQYLEFANVGVKHELQIETGYAGGGTAINLAGYF